MFRISVLALLIFSVVSELHWEGTDAPIRPIAEVAAGANAPACAPSLSRRFNKSLGCAEGYLIPRILRGIDYLCQGFLKPLILESSLDDLGPAYHH